MILRVILLLIFSTISIYSQKFDGLAKTPPMGWNKFASDVNEKLIKETADAMVKTV